MNARSLALALVLAASAFSGCTTAVQRSATAPSAQPSSVPATREPDDMVRALNAQNPFSVLKRGMTAKQVSERVGAPDEVVPFPNDAGANSEIWAYVRSVPVSFREVVGGTRPVTYVDPFTSEMKEIMEPIMRYETVFADQRIELLMVEGLFVEWKQRAHSVKNISN